MQVHDEIQFLEILSGVTGWGKQDLVNVDGMTWNCFKHPANRRWVVVATTGADYPKLHAAYIMKCKVCGRYIFSQKLYTRKQFNGHQGSEPSYFGHIHLGSIKDRKLRKSLKPMFEKE